MKARATTVVPASERSALPAGDYISPNLTIVLPDKAFRDGRRYDLLERVAVSASGDQPQLVHYGRRHLEYWLSGLRDMRKVVAATGLDQVEAPRVLDFGGASGRVIRHFRGWKPGVQLFLSDISPQHVLLAKQLFGGSVMVLHNHGLPTLPLPDAFFDCVVAFSVFTHIDADDTAWLLELRRIAKAGGHLYVTVCDQATWDILPETVAADVSFANEDFRRYHAENSMMVR